MAQLASKHNRKAIKLRSEVQGNCFYITFAEIHDVAHLIRYRQFW